MFNKLFDEVERDGKMIEVPVFLNLDEFIAAMWNF